MNICVKSNEEQRKRETKSTRDISTLERYVTNMKIIYEVYKNLIKFPNGSRFFEEHNTVSDADKR